MKKLRLMGVVIVALAMLIAVLPAADGAAQTLLVDTGAASNVLPAPSLFNNRPGGLPGSFNLLAGQFTLANGALIDGAQAWLGPCFCFGGTLDVRIRLDDGGLPGAVILSKTYALPNRPGPATPPPTPSGSYWAEFSEFITVLPAGTYWLALEPPAGSTLNYSMPMGAPNPLARYAFSTEGNSGYLAFGSPSPALGMRISGTSFTDVAHGTAARVIANDGNVFPPPQRQDLVAGAAGDIQTNIVVGFNPSRGWARGEITETGLEAGALAQGATGEQAAARGVAFRSFINNTGVSQTLTAHAVVDGRFLAAPFGLENGNVAAGASIYVFDTVSLSAVLNASGQTAGERLLTSADQTRDAELLTEKNFSEPLSLAGHLNLTPLRQVHRYYGMGGVGSVLIPSSVSDTLTAEFTVAPGQVFTLMFDIHAHAAGNGFATADFISTMAPAPVLFTDADGNPATGILMLGPSVPPAANAVTLTPATSTLPAGGTATLTATVTNGAGEPVPDAVVRFTVTSGPNAGAENIVATNEAGQATFTYADTGGPGTDAIQAFADDLASSAAQVTWQAPSTGTCPRSEEYWAVHPSSWPVSSLKLGKQTYNKLQLLALLVLGDLTRLDASTVLAVELAAAKLNLANDSDPAPVSSAVAAADALLNGFSGKLPYKVKPTSALGRTMAQQASALRAYNTGQLTPGCTP
jgi:hypothetical protein